MTSVHRLFQICALLVPFFIECSLAQANVNPAQTAPEAEAAPIVFIGHEASHHYVIVIPSLNGDSKEDKVRSQLVRIRDKVAVTGQTPFIAQNHLGRYIYAGGFTQRHQAEATLQQLLKDEPKARVVYFP
jgi:hypothetical protein